VFDFLSHSLDLFFGLLTAKQWESWRGWLTTLGGLVAVIIALVTYIRNVRIKNEEQARKIYAEAGRGISAPAGEFFAAQRVLFAAHPDVGRWETHGNLKQIRTKVDHDEFVIRVKNMSDEIIGPVLVGVLHRQHNHSDRSMSLRFSVVKPGEDGVERVALPALTTTRGVLPTVTVTFRDSGGRWWSRTETDPIRRANAPSKQVAWLRRLIGWLRRKPAVEERSSTGEPSVGGPPADGQ
jgi:hypothetical protein